MKKALTITIAGTLFTIEEDAYQKLDGYLKSVTHYFGSYPDNAEIINDISGFTFDTDIADVAAKSGAGVVLMHTRGRPQNMQSSQWLHQDDYHSCE